MAQILEVMAELSADIEGWGISEHTTFEDIWRTSYEYIRYHVCRAIYYR